MMLDGVKVAVTGACGFLGNAIVHRLVKTGVLSVVCIDVTDPSDPVCDDESLRVSYVRADVRDADTLARVLDAFGVVLVFHCASLIDLCPVRADPRTHGQPQDASCLVWCMFHLPQVFSCLVIDHRLARMPLVWQVVMNDLELITELAEISTFVDSAHTRAPPTIFVQVMTDEVYDVNVNGTRAVIAACIQARTVQALVYTSSIDVTFDGNPVRLGTEERPYPRNPGAFNGYIHSKVLAEKEILAANGSRLRTAALRPSHIFGPGDPMIPLVVDMVRCGEAPFILGDGRNENDYVFVENVATGHVQCAHSMLFQACWLTRVDVFVFVF